LDLWLSVGLAEALVDVDVEVPLDVGEEVVTTDENVEEVLRVLEDDDEEPPEVDDGADVELEVEEADPFE